MNGTDALLARGGADNTDALLARGGADNTDALLARGGADNTDILLVRDGAADTASLLRNVLLVDHRAAPDAPAWYVEEGDEAARRAHAALRHHAFVAEQGLFAGTDRDAPDEDPRTRVLVARAAAGSVLGGVRLGPADPGGPDVGWWTGSRLVAAPGAPRGVGPALVRAACVGPGGDVLATTGVAPGVAVADVDVPAVLAGARRAMAHLRDRRPETYGVSTGV